MKIGIICNHLFGLPSIIALASQNLIGGLAVPDFEHSAVQHIKQMAAASKIPMGILRRNYLAVDIKTWLNKTEIDVVFVYSFPYKIPGTVLNLPRLGFINFHPSMLPAYRGSDPIFYQLKNGEKNSGITAHIMSEKIDSGNIVCRETEIINDNDTYGILENKFAFTALRCTNNLINILHSYELKNISEEQKEDEFTLYRKPKDQDLVIYWNNYGALEVKNLVRACNPKYQGAITYFRNIPVRILEVSSENETFPNAIPGQILDTKLQEGIEIVCKNNEVVSAKVIYVNEGCFTGSLFRNIFNVISGEIFITPNNS